MALVVLGIVMGTALPASSSSPVRRARHASGQAQDAVGEARTAVHGAWSQLQDLDVQLADAAERLHEGRILLHTLRTDLALAGVRTERADLAAADAGDRLDATARWAYENGGSTAWLSALLGMGSLSDISQGVGLLSALAGNQVDVARSAGAARERARQAEAQQLSLEASVTHALEGIRQASADLRVAIAKERRLIARLEQRLQHRISDAAAARAAVQQAIREEAARQAREAAGIPTPPPGAPAPPPENEIDALIYSFWGTGPDGRVAECIADKESGDNPLAVNQSSGSTGLFQLMPFWWDGNNSYGWRFDPFDARENARHAYLIWKADGWGPWTTRPLCT